MLTDNPNDPELGYGIDKESVPQNKKYLILSNEERNKGFIRPVRETYIHVGKNPKMSGIVLIRPDENACGTRTTMALAIAETYARNPKFYGSTYCCSCQKHLSVSEFIWEGTEERVGS
jgi:hypothetical protein